MIIKQARYNIGDDQYISKVESSNDYIIVRNGEPSISETIVYLGIQGEPNQEIVINNVNTYYLGKTGILEIENCNYDNGVEIKFINPKFIIADCICEKGGSANE